MIKYFEPKKEVKVSETSDLLLGLLCVAIMVACVYLIVYLLKIILCV